MGHQRTFTPSPALLAVLLALALVLPTGVTRAHASTPSYAALGDSYSAGNATSHASGSCRRSDLAYGPLLADRENLSDTFEHRACTGADTADLREKQLDTLGPGTRLVTLTIGGNDHHAFLATVAACVINPARFICDKTAKKIGEYIETSLPKTLGATYRDIADKLGPDSTVLVGGYPQLYDASAPRSACGTLGPAKTVRTKLNTMAETLDRVIAIAVEKADHDYPQHWSYVPADFSGHELCTEDPWLAGAEEIAHDPLGAWHPNDEGHQHYAKQFAGRLE